MIRLFYDCKINAFIINNQENNSTLMVNFGMILKFSTRNAVIYHLFRKFAVENKYQYGYKQTI